MKTENVFFADIYCISGVDYSSWYNEIIKLTYVKHALVCRKKKFLGKAYMKDLNSNQKYKLKLSNKAGTMYVSNSSLEEFNIVTENDKRHLSKAKIKTLGNKYLRK